MVRVGLETSEIKSLIGLVQTSRGMNRDIKNTLRLKLSKALIRSNRAKKGKRHADNQTP